MSLRMMNGLNNSAAISFGIPHSWIRVKAHVRENEALVEKLIETTVGRVLFNQLVPEEAGYINMLLTKKALRDIIGDIIKATDIPTTARFLDEIKNLGFNMAFKGGLSFNLSDLLIPDNKQEMLKVAQDELD